LNLQNVSRQWDHPIETNAPIKRQRLDLLSTAERAELNQQLKDVVEVSLIRPCHKEFGSPLLFVRQADGSLLLCIDYHGLNKVTRKHAYPLPRMDDTVDELKNANLDTHFDLASSFLQVREREEDVHKTAFKTIMVRWNRLPCHSGCVMHRLRFIT
jgi:hypothetical protein